MKTPARKCYLCEKRPAKKLPAHNYKYAYSEPAFCSQRCAASWALIEISGQLSNGTIHECNQTGQLEDDEAVHHGCEEPVDWSTDA